jgi:DNA repair protein RadD
VDVGSPRFMKVSKEITQLVNEILGKAPDSKAVREFDDENPEEPVSARVEFVRRSLQEPPLFDYQRELAEQVSGVIANHEAALISLPTGGGKTRMAMFAVLDFLARCPAGKVIWLAPTRELLDQAHDTFLSLWNDFGRVGDVGISRKSENRAEGGFIWLATPQGVRNQVSEVGSLGWDLIVFDEAHQSSAPTFSATVSKLRDLTGAALLGLSATPGRTNEDEVESLLDVFEDRLIVSDTLGKDPVKFLQDRGVLSRLDFKNLANGPGGFLKNIERLRIATESIVEVSKRGGKALVFCKSVQDSVALSYALRDRGVQALHVEGNQSEALRRERIGLFAQAKCLVLTNQKLLATGYDCPAVDNVYLVAKVGSPILFEQMVGRAARGVRTGGSRRSTIWEFDDHLGLHGLPQSYYRYQEFGWRVEK